MSELDDRIYQYQPLFGSWNVEEEIGEGSFGIVYRVSKEQLGKKYISAVKLISIPSKEQYREASNSLGDDENTLHVYFRDIVENIIKEVNILHSLSGNINVLNYHDHNVFEREDKIGWDILIRMEFVTPLSKYLKNSSMSREQVVQLGINICTALDLCSKKGIIHRDVKDENIFINEDGIFKLGDFGIARELSGSGRAASMRGTPLYMAPEVYRGERYNVTVDIYSLGIVLYKLLNNGRMPFMPLYPVTIKYDDIEESQYRRMSGEALLLPVNAGEELGRIVVKACAFKPEDRYTTAAEMRKELETVIAEMDEETKQKKITPLIFAKPKFTKTASESKSKDETTISTYSDPVQAPVEETEKTVSIYNEIEQNSADDPHKTVSIFSSLPMDGKRDKDVEKVNVSSTRDDEQNSADDSQKTVSIYSSLPMDGKRDIKVEKVNTDNTNEIEPHSVDDSHKTVSAFLGPPEYGIHNIKAEVLNTGEDEHPIKPQSNGLKKWAVIMTSVLALFVVFAILLNAGRTNTNSLSLPAPTIIQSAAADKAAADKAAADKAAADKAAADKAAADKAAADKAAADKAAADKAAADKAAADKAVTVPSLRDSKGPVVALDEVYTVTTSTATISFFVTDDSRVTEVLVGFEKVMVRPDGSTVFTANNLIVGVNEFDVLAYDEYGNATEATLVIEYLKSSNIVLTIGSISANREGDLIALDQPPIILNGRIYLPVRSVLQDLLGGSINYDSPTGILTAVVRGNTIKLTIGQKNAYVNGNKILLLVAPFIDSSNWCLYSAFREISEAIGIQMEWNATTQTITFTIPE